MTKDQNKKNIDFFPTPYGNNDNLLSLLNRTSDLICKWFSETNNLGPLPHNNDFIPSTPQVDGCEIDTLLEDIESLIYTSFNPVHPGSLAHLDPPPLTISILGDLIASGLNNNLLAEELSPSISKLEDQICKWFAKEIGFNDNSGGIAASGGTLNNLNALVTAKYCCEMNIDNEPVLILSRDAHVSFKKCGRILGIQEENIILIETDNNGCMDVILLYKAIQNIIKTGKKIIAIVATLGTTFRGALDPINQIGSICKQHNIWFHIDASIGGVFLLTKNKVSYFSDLNLKNANSITINPQKILGIAKTSSLLLVSDFEKLKETFHTGLPYIDSTNDVINRGELGVQGSRPAEIIKLWLGLRFLGIKGIDEILNEAVRKKNLFNKLLDKNKFETFSSPLHIVSFLPKFINQQSSNNWTLFAKKELLRNKYMISRPYYQKQYYLRIVFGNFNTKDENIILLAELLNNLI